MDAPEPTADPAPPVDPSPATQGPFKPNIYPIMFWALTWGAAAGLVLFLLNILSRFITVVWAPVFIGGLLWGGWRNYQRQKAQWHAGSGVPPTPQSPWEEVRDAVRDITDATRSVVQGEEPPPPEETPPPEAER